jgi:hypothetical protein
MAIWYIDPTTASESDAYDGGYGSGKLRDLYSDVSGLAAGDAIYFRSGTTHPGRCTLTTTGTVAAYITIGKYGGSARAIIDAQGGSNGTGAFLCNGVSYVRVSGIHGINNTAAGGAGVTALRSSYIEITDCEGSDCQMGIRVAQDQAATVGNVLVRDNYCHDNTFVGVFVECGSIANAIVGDVDIQNNVIERNGFAEGSETYPRAGISARSNYRTTVDATRSPYGIRSIGNILRGNSGYGISYDPVIRGGRGNSMIGNEVTGQNPLLDDDSHCLWVGGSQDVTILGNRAHHNFGRSGAASGSGVGIFIDQFQDGTVSTQCRVIGNEVHDQFTGENSAQFASAGIFFFHATNCVASGNLVYGCRNGIAIRGDTTNNTEDIAIYNNTCADITEVAYGAAYKADRITYRNNIAVNAATGFFAETGASAVLNVDRDYGIAFGCEEAWAEGTLSAQVAGSAGSNDSVDDPLLDSSYRPSSSSPCIDAGTQVAGVVLRDYYGKEITGTPDIGAVQRYAARSASTARTESTARTASTTRSYPMRRGIP